MTALDVSYGDSMREVSRPRLLFRCPVPRRIRSEIVFPQTREQRCWVHKTANVLNKLPTGVQPKAKAMLYDIWMAETQPAADRAFDLFLATFAAKFPAATTCLAKDRDGASTEGTSARRTESVRAPFAAT